MKVPKWIRDRFGEIAEGLKGRVVNVSSLLIGDKTLFAFKLAVDNDFVSVDIFCGSEEMGDNNQYVQLKTFSSLIDGKLRAYNYELADEIKGLDKDAIYSYVVHGYENAGNWIESQRLESLWITLNLALCLDGDIIILLSNNLFDRVVWKKFNSKDVGEIFLPAGYVFKQFESLLNILSN
ncbi:immunity 42 family protein [Cronobacter dublinensis subsp. infanticibi]|uniref:Imm42 family immunity protein n=1 Tax=Cronobacter dublinensis TaxID=413497 RepID=UPI0023DD3AB0|nr:Imm42 family immunity protein [Cronobacter dublinensis]WEP45485.1 immunity 42 family protein [Cronobacter dublinensis]